MGKWEQCSDDAVCWEGEGVRLELQGDKVRLAPNDLKEACQKHNADIADVIVNEWQEVWVKVQPDARAIWFGEEEARKKPNDWWSFTFQNYLGKSFIRITFGDGKQVTTEPIEVVSTKTPLDLDKQDDALFYPRMLGALIDDLIRYVVSLPFDWATPTEFPTEERPQPPSPIFVLHVLAQHAETISHALQTIWRNPHRRLVTEERWVMLNEAGTVDADTILMMLHHPEYLRSYRGSSLNMLAQRLKGKVPERVFERRVTETLDTPENRLIKRFMDTVLYWCDELQRLNYWQKAQSHQLEFQTLREFVRFLRADPLFADVGELTIFPASSQVLLRRDGYRECLQVYRLLHIARAPIFDRLQEAIDNRSIDQLYEFWCFFRLAKELAEILGSGRQPRFSTLESDERGLRQGLSAKLGNGYQLIYNRAFPHGKGSYSIPLRPDFSLMKNNNAQPVVVFDAKFRFDEKDIDITPLSQPLDEEMDEAQQEGDIERLAKHADICKMHTYRDALKCRAAVILFPGTQCVFFRATGMGKDQCKLSDIVRNSEWEGVGALPLIPGDDEKTEV